ncbi:MAG: hypothetical protein IJ806_01635 [Ruminococcus sp.]|nr:hypothetical protein [Ruminococcus sp.]
MSKHVMIINRIMAALCFSALGVSLVFFIIKWGSLPAEPGIHFDLKTGEFDVYAAKVLGFYPHVIGALLLGAIVLVQRAAAKKSLGLRVNEEGDKIIRTELCLTLDLIMVYITLFCLNWSFAVSLQRGGRC